jgi:hypothetical protein
VRLKVHAEKPVAAKIRIRTPSWAAHVMDIEVNGERIATGTPGSSVTLDRTWSQGDTISFVLPMALKVTQYIGVDRIEGRERFALEYGPLLMAALDAADSEVMLDGSDSPFELANRLQPQPEQPLHFTLPLDRSATVWAPYFEVGTETFSCFPFIRSGSRFL